MKKATRIRGTGGSGFFYIKRRKFERSVCVQMSALTLCRTLRFNYTVPLPLLAAAILPFQRGTAPLNFEQGSACRVLRLSVAGIFQVHPDESDVQNPQT
jgi:hypothetical protein